MSSLQLRYAKSEIIYSTVNVMGFMLAITYGIFFLTRIALSRAGIELLANGLSY